MNGRVYDYNVGRFLSVDPFLQFPENSQSANPYTYILNNPMSGTDPTGYQSESDKEEATEEPTDKKYELTCEGSARKLCNRTGHGAYIKEIGSGDKNDNSGKKKTEANNAGKQNKGTTNQNQTLFGDGQHYGDDGLVADLNNLVKINTSTNKKGETVIERYIADTLSARAVLTIQKSDGKVVTIRNSDFQETILDFSAYLGGETVLVDSAYRSAKKQTSLVKKGNPRAAKKSPHTYSDAADIYLKGWTNRQVAVKAHASGLFRRTNWYKTSGGYTHVDQWAEKTKGYYIDWYRQ